MPSQKQEAFFEELLNNRQFPEGSPSADTMRTQFKSLSQDAGSAWIEKAIALPKVDSAQGDNSPPPF